MSDDNNNDGIYRVDTVPPPDGEDDAYSAPTKVGPMADAAVKELMNAAERRATELVQRNADKAKAAKDSAEPTKPPPALAAPTKPPPATSAVTKPPPMMPAAVTKPPPAIPAAEILSPEPAASPNGAISSAPNNTVATATAGPVTGRAPAPVVGPVGRTVASPPASAAKPPSGPKPPRTAPRPAGAALAPAPPLPKKPSPIDPMLPLSAEATADAMAQSLADAEPPPRLYDETDETDDAATLLHASAKPPRQEITALIPSVHAAAAVPGVNSVPPPVVPPVPESAPAMVRTREPIPFERPAGPPLAETDQEPRVLIMPLVVGFLIFAIGLAFYIWAR